MSVALELETQLGHAIPPHHGDDRHAITFHLPHWTNLMRFVEKDPTIFAALKSVYPRMLLHTDVKTLVGHILKFAKVGEGYTAFIFPTAQSAAECKEFSMFTQHGDDALTDDQIIVRIFDVHVRLYVVIFPANKMPQVLPFWQNSGTGLASRLAAECLERIELLKEVTDDTPSPKTDAESGAQVEIREAIVRLLNCAPLDAERAAKVNIDDVYLFQSGMTAIYRIHRYLLQKFGGRTAFFGWAFHSTLHIFPDFGPGWEQFGCGSEEELDQLEALLESESKNAKPIQAIWAEFPSNPLLGVADLTRLRKMADKYHCLLILDDTIGSFCNVDLLSVVDILITSLTKSFSGYADVMGASAVLNPSLSRYAELKELFTKCYTNDYCDLDAIVMAQNSIDYLARSTTLNSNTATLVSYLQTCVENPTSTVTKVYYPTTSPLSLTNFKKFQRPQTSDFTPGYGCLACVEFDTIEATEAFYDNCNLHIGPHLGAHRTIVLPYVKALYGKELEWAGKYGLRETQLRVAPGLESWEVIKESFERGLKAADATKKA
ncbi:pyridoxal phosphate-dependent transferase [Tricladium varicosporioides]|nr:pyridoxal phosphate-dependent transferase [Hymenoscyphus varicosporioides]